jgi:hypothetical protein
VTNDCVAWVRGLRGLGESRGETQVQTQTKMGRTAKPVTTTTISSSDSEEIGGDGPFEPMVPCLAYLQVAGGAIACRCRSGNAHQGMSQGFMRTRGSCEH